MGLGLDDTRPRDKKEFTVARGDIAKREAGGMRHPSRIAERSTEERVRNRAKFLAAVGRTVAAAIQKCPASLPGISLVYFSILSNYCVTSWLECGPFATEVRQMGCVPVGKGEFATPDKAPVFALNCPAEIEPSR